MSVPRVALGAQKCHQHGDSPGTHPLGALSSSCQLFLQPWIQCPQRNQNQFRHLIPGWLRVNWFGINRVQRGSESPWNVLGWKRGCSPGDGRTMHILHREFFIKGWGFFLFFLLLNMNILHVRVQNNAFFGWLCTFHGCVPLHCITERDPFTHRGKGD